MKRHFQNMDENHLNPMDTVPLRSPAAIGRVTGTGRRIVKCPGRPPASGRRREGLRRQQEGLRGRPVERRRHARVLREAGELARAGARGAQGLLWPWRTHSWKGIAEHARCSLCGGGRARPGGGGGSGTFSDSVGKVLKTISDGSANCIIESHIFPESGRIRIALLAHLR